MEQNPQSPQTQNLDPTLRAPQPGLDQQAEVISGLINTLPHNSQIDRYMGRPSHEGASTNKEQFNADLTQAMQMAEQGYIGRANFLTGMVNAEQQAHQGSRLPNLRGAFESLHELNLTDEQTNFHTLFRATRPTIQLDPMANNKPGSTENDQAYASAAALLAEGRPNVMTGDQQGRPYSKLFGIKDPTTGQPLKNVYMEVWSGLFNDKDGTTTSFSSGAHASLIVLPNRLVEKPSRRQHAAEIRGSVAGSNADGPLLQVLEAVETTESVAQLSEEQQNKMLFDRFVGTLIGLGDITTSDGRKLNPAETLRDADTASKNWANFGKTLTRAQGLRAAVDALVRNPGTAKLLDRSEHYTINEGGQLIPANMDQLDAYLNTKSITGNTKVDTTAWRQIILDEVSAYAHNPEYQGRWDTRHLLESEDPNNYSTQLVWEQHVSQQAAEAGVDMNLVKQSAEAMRKLVSNRRQVGQAAVAGAIGQSHNYIFR